MLSAVATDFNADQLTRDLTAGLDQLEVALPPPAIAALVGFVRELNRWNQAYNLTAVRDPGDMIPRHLLDSLTALPFVRGERVLDVGCGGGLPGIPLAIALPAIRFVLLDSNAKKQRFVEHIARTLKLANVEPVHARVEQYTAVPFDTIICRALATLAEFVAGAEHLLAPGGQLVALKGRLPEAEIAALPKGWEVTVQQRVHVPGLDGERHIIQLQKSQT
jgi:16S rRNA (guanine527-N7)-methyltransferase